MVVVKMTDTLPSNSIEALTKALKPAIIDRAIQKHNELRLIQARESKIRQRKISRTKKKSEYPKVS